ncbi:MAG: hypothetical protein J6U54_09660 [Clostridiales bacterium]|nr:hypothetical protein [Clostridiales bacterium]
MAKRTILNAKPPADASVPALSPEDREQQLINLAVNLAEQQLLDGTASSQVITHYLKAGSLKEKYELERLREENKLLRARTEAIQNSQHIEELYKEAMQAFKGYLPDPDDQEVPPDEGFTF